MSSSPGSSLAEPEARTAPATDRDAIAADLIAVLAAVTAGDPRVLTIKDRSALPSGPFEVAHRSLQAGLRAWVESQTRHPLGYVEQLYTFADRDRALAGARVISISYPSLTREQPAPGYRDVRWCSCSSFFPWEAHRAGTPPVIESAVLPRLTAWAEAAESPVLRQSRRQRVGITFGCGGHVWNEELVLQRYELLYEAGLIPEAIRGTLGTGALGPGEKPAAAAVSA